jgi:hypothetical protein
VTFLREIVDAPNVGLKHYPKRVVGHPFPKFPITALKQRSGQFARPSWEKKGDEQKAGFAGERASARMKDSVV